MSADRELIELHLRGRALRLCRPDDVLLVSPRGEGVPEDVPAGDVRVGDMVGVQYGGTWSDRPAALPVFVPSRRWGTEKELIVPAEMNDDLAFLLGAYLSEGTPPGATGR